MVKKFPNDKSECKTCLHHEVCLASFSSGERCGLYKDKELFIELPVKVGTSYYRVERFCTEGGFCEEPKKVTSEWDCEGGCEKCDGQLRVVEYRFQNVIQILNAQEYIGTQIFLTPEEAIGKFPEAKMI